MKKKKNLKKTVGFGYVGRWWGGQKDPDNGELGWCMPGHVEKSHGKRKYISRQSVERTPWAKDHKLVLCKITVEQVFDKKGREIAHYVGGKKKKNDIL